MGEKNVYMDKAFALGGRRISHDVSAFTLDPSRAEVAWASFEDVVDRVLKGAFSSELGMRGAVSGDWEARVLESLVDDDDPLAVTLALGAAGAAAGTFAAMCEALVFGFKHTGDWNQVKGFELGLRADDRIEFGAVLFNSLGGAGVTGAVAGPGVELGPVLSGGELIVNYHVVDPPGVSGTNPTLSAVLESNVDNVTWATTAVVRHTFDVAVAGAPGAGQFKAPGAQVVKLAGAIPDPWWRYRVTGVGGTASPKFYPFLAGVARKL